MTKWILYAALFGIVLLIATTSRSDVAPSLPPPQGTGDAVAEPITGSAAMPDPGEETAPRDPFGPYDIGSANAAWQYAQLKPAEQAIADKGRNPSGWDQVNNAFASAAAERAHKAAGDSAAAQLGMENLAGQGVVP